MSDPERPRRQGRACRAVDREALLYFFNDLPRRRRRAVRRHLAACPLCRGKLAAFGAAWAREGQTRNGRRG